MQGSDGETAPRRGSVGYPVVEMVAFLSELAMFATLGVAAFVAAQLLNDKAEARGRRSGGVVLVVEGVVDDADGREAMQWE